MSRKIERLVELALRVDGLEEIAASLDALKLEREQLTAAVRAAEGGFDAQALRIDVESRLADLGVSLAASPEEGRRALRALFRDERPRVGPHPERGFQVEGTAWLSVDLESGDARGPQTPGRPSRMVAEGRFARVCAPVSLPVPLVLPAVGQAAPRAA